MGCSLLGSSVHGILQARILEWVAISFSNDEEARALLFWERNTAFLEIGCLISLLFCSVTSSHGHAYVCPAVLKVGESV